MSNLMFPRRNFLIGLGSLLAAPAVVKASSIMPVKLFDPYYTRYLAAYDITTDQILLRVDRSLKPLSMPLHGVGIWNVSKEMAHKYIKQEFINSIRPLENQQKSITVPIPGHELS